MVIDAMGGGMEIAATSLRVFRGSDYQLSGFGKTGQAVISTLLIN